MLDGSGTAAHVGTRHHCYTTYNFKWFCSGERTEGRRHLKPIRIRVAGIRLACFVNKLSEPRRASSTAPRYRLGRCPTVAMGPFAGINLGLSGDVRPPPPGYSPSSTRSCPAAELTLSVSLRNERRSGGSPSISCR